MRFETNKDETVNNRTSRVCARVLQRGYEFHSKRRARNEGDSLFLGNIDRRIWNWNSGHLTPTIRPWAKTTISPTFTSIHSFHSPGLLFIFLGLNLTEMIEQKKLPRCAHPCGRRTSHRVFSWVKLWLSTIHSLKWRH